MQDQRIRRVNAPIPTPRKADPEVQQGGKEGAQIEPAFQRLQAFGDSLRVPYLLSSSGQPGVFGKTGLGMFVDLLSPRNSLV